MSDTPQAVLLADYRPPEFLIDQAEFWFTLDDAATQVRGRLQLRRNPEVPAGDGSLWLDGEGLELLEIRLDDHPLPPTGFRQEEGGLRLLGVPDRCQVETQVRIHPQANTALEGLYRSGPMLCTQCEPEGFRKISFFIDRPDVMARFRVTLVGDRARYPVLLANGNPAGQEDLPDGQHLACWDDPFPKPCYLFALVAGRLERVEDRFVTASGRAVALHLYVEADGLDQCGHALASLKRAMAWDERRFGREYDLEVYQIVAVGDFNMGAMENKGLNIFNARYVLAAPDTATDQDFQAIEGVIGHEYFHNWTGNRISCRDWFQLALKEGFTVFRDQEFSSDMGSRAVKRITDARTLRVQQFTEDAGPMAHPVRPRSYIEINNFYTATVYEKGAELVRMLARLLGPATFRRAADLFFDRHDGQAVTTEDFLRCMADASGRGLSQFQRWYEQAGTPVLEVAGRYDPAGQTYSLRVRQSCPATPGQPSKGPFHIPLAVGLLGPDGAALRLADADGETRLLELRRQEEVFHFSDIRVPPVPSLLRGFSAPVKVHYPYQDEELLRLMAHDPDPFARWDAAQRLTERIILGNLPGHAGPLQVPAGLAAAFGTALGDRHADPALLAEILALPSESYLGDQLNPVDVDGLHRVREALKTHLAQALAGPFQATYDACRDPGPYRPEPLAMGRRALRNRSLDYLAQTGPGLDLCWEQFRAGHNLTDVLAALRLLAASDSPHREEALDTFYHQWQHNPLVVDKWLAVQAQSKRADTLERVEALLGHPCCGRPNPNRVRALIGGFCANPVRFHRPDGAGYRFLADRVLELDPRNPQVAARLLRSLARWRSHEPIRQHLMQAQLRRVLEVRGLSRDSYEIAVKSLAS